MMSEIKNIFDISGRAMAAQLVRLNTVASNLANAGTIASTKEEAFRALKPVFKTTYADQLNIVLHYDIRVLAPNQAEDLLNTYVGFVRNSIGHTPK